jgi:hypothetical protein
VQNKNTSPAHHSNAYVLVEGPPWGDAEFLGKWLLAAAQAEGFGKEAYEDPIFREHVDRICTCHIPHFGISGSIMVMQLREYRTTFVIDLNSEDGDDFTMMVAMGFFLLTDDKYQMAIPASLTAATVRAAVIASASCTWKGESFGLQPNRTPRACARAPPSAVRARIMDRSNSAKAPSTAMMSLR